MIKLVYKQECTYFVYQVLINPFFRTYAYVTLSTARHLGTKPNEYQSTTASLKISYVSVVQILPDADVHQTEKEAESTFLPHENLHWVEKIRIIHGDHVFY